MVHRTRNWNVSSVTRRREREANGRLVFVQKFVDLTACFGSGDVSRVACRVGPVAETVCGVRGHGCGSVGQTSRTTLNGFLLFIYVICLHHQLERQSSTSSIVWHRQCFTSSVQERTSLECHSMAPAYLSSTSNAKSSWPTTWARQTTLTSRCMMQRQCKVRLYQALLDYTSNREFRVQGRLSNHPTFFLRCRQTSSRRTSWQG